MMPRLFLILLMLFVSATEAVPTKIKIPDEKTFWQLRDSKNSQKIKFEEKDFFGIWKDESNKNDTFILNEDLKFEFGYKTGICKIISQNNNKMLLQCTGNLGKKLKSQYILLKIFYFANNLSSADLMMDITFNRDEKCAKNEDLSEKNKCFEDGEDQHYDMYFKSKK